VCALSMSYKWSLPNTLPKKLINSAKSLEHLGIVELAWDCQNAVMVVEFLCEYNYAILGGDVYRLINGGLESTYDSWYLNKDVTKSREQFVEESKNKAIAYISQYHARNGDDFYYSLVSKRNKFE